MTDYFAALARVTKIRPAPFAGASAVQTFGSKALPPPKCLAPGTTKPRPSPQQLRRKAKNQPDAGGELGVPRQPQVQFSSLPARPLPAPLAPFFCRLAAGEPPAGNVAENDAATIFGRKLVPAARRR